MRRTLLACLTLLVSFSTAHAQPRFPLSVSQVRIGFPGGMDVEPVPLFKAGTWAPVYVDIKAELPGYRGTEGPIEVIVTAPDPDDVATNYTVSSTLPALAPNQTHTVLSYTKVAGSSPEITVTLRDPATGNGIGQPLKKSFNGLEAHQYLFLTLGARLPGLREAARVTQQRAGMVIESVAYIDKVDQLPIHWFAYQGIDTVLLCTSNRDNFLLPFANPNAPQYRQALVEWVERGGHLVVCAGRNQSDLNQIAELQRLLPVTFTKSEQVGELTFNFGDGGDTLKGPIEVARFKPKNDRPVYSLLEGPLERSAIVQAPFGLGRVTVLMFDPEQKPFADWKRQADEKGIEDEKGQDLGEVREVGGRAGFWRTFFLKSGTRPAQIANDNRQQYEVYQSAELLSRLQNYLENFDDVPVIPFGWVFLFILIYILIVGPLDYFFLKKVVKRLELTWITFPTVVLVVSALAYFTAYQVKGKDLRIRKVDVVDVDLRSQQAVGHTWFTLFSPRIQHYTIGVEPAAPTWGVKPKEEAKQAAVVVSWMNRPESARYGSRARRQSLFRRSYDFEPDASGLKGVPIQVWATKSFTATWQSDLPVEQPLIVANVRSAGPEQLTGEITWWPAGGKSDLVLKDAVLIYNERVASLSLQPGTAKKIDEVHFPQNGIAQWAKLSDAQSNNNYYGNNWRSTPPKLDETLRASFFQQASGTQQNASLRFLDQSWRAEKDKNAVILVGRLETQKGDAEDVTRTPASASRLWLGSLPGEPRQPLVGLMQQETYIRVFIPIQP
jgi:hypothetical protein